MTHRLRCPAEVTRTALSANSPENSRYPCSRPKVTQRTSLTAAGPNTDCGQFYPSHATRCTHTRRAETPAQLGQRSICLPGQPAVSPEAAGGLEDAGVLAGWDPRRRLWSAHPSPVATQGAQVCSRNEFCFVSQGSGPWHPFLKLATWAMDQGRSCVCVHKDKVRLSGLCHPDSPTCNSLPNQAPTAGSVEQIAAGRRGTPAW